MPCRGQAVKHTRLKAIGPVCCVLYVKELSVTIVKGRGLPWCVQKGLAQSCVLKKLGHTCRGTSFLWPCGCLTPLWVQM